MSERSVLIIEAGRDSMQVLASRIQRLGYRVVRAKTLDQAFEAVQAPRFGIQAAIVPPDLPVLDLGDALGELRRVARCETLRFLAAGTRPTRELRHTLASAGVDYPLFEPVDAHTLRFQLNRALAPPVLRARHSARVPIAWPIDVLLGRRRKETRAYSVSPSGIYLATPKPAMRRTLVRVALPIPGCAVKVAGKVVTTNVPGNLMKRNLPLGMGVQFTGLDEQTELALAIFVEERMRNLDL